MEDCKGSYIVSLNPKRSLRIRHRHLRISKAFGLCFISTCRPIPPPQHRLHSRSIWWGTDGGQSSTTGTKKHQQWDAYIRVMAKLQYYKANIDMRRYRVSMFYHWVRYIWSMLVDTIVFYFRRCRGEAGDGWEVDILVGFKLAFFGLDFLGWREAIIRINCLLFRPISASLWSIAGGLT